MGKDIPKQAVDKTLKHSSRQIITKEIHAPLKPKASQGI
jgi:hypothetical protein